MKQIEWEKEIVEKVTSADLNKHPLFKQTSKDKYYKVVWFGKIENAEKYAKKVEHTKKIIVIEDAHYREFGYLVSYQKLWFGIRVKYIKDYKQSNK